MSFHIIEGDLEPDLELQILINGDAADLTGSLAYSMTWKAPDGTVTTGSDLTAIDLATGLFQHTWASGETDQVGRYEAIVIVTRANGEMQTFPSNGRHFRWYVDERLA